ncbi:unnamed protein product [Schistosoma turkestanicum]|nr:unnamed protein product [Schistosoma turkestanicum]
MNEYIPSNINLKKKNGTINVTRVKQPTATKVKSKLASRKVVFENPVCLNDNDVVADELSIQNEADYYGTNNNVTYAIPNKTGDVGSNNEDNGPIDLKGKVQDLSIQLEEICKYARSSLNENDVCFCHDLVGGKCLLPQNHTYAESPRLKTPPEVWFSKPDCCQSCTVPCCVKADLNSTNLIGGLQELQPLTDEKLLQNNLDDISHRLSLLQDKCAPKCLSSSISNKIERDIDEHLEKLKRQNSTEKRYLHPSINRTSKYQTVTGKSTSDQKKSVGQQSLKSNLKSKTADKLSNSCQQKNKVISKQKLPHSSYDKSKLPSNKLQRQSLSESLDEKKDNYSTKRITFDEDVDNDPETTLDKLEKYLETSGTIIDEKVNNFETKNSKQDVKLDETKEMMNELRSVYQEIKELLLNVRHRVDQNNNIKLEETEKIDTNTHSDVLLSNSQPVLTPGSLLPSIRLVMDYSGKTISPTNDITQLISNLPDNPIVKASSELCELNRRRMNLENNLAALECSHNDQSIFGLLELLSKDKSSVEKARIQAMINDAINKVVNEKKLEQHSRSIGRVSRLTRPKSQSTTGPKQIKDTISTRGSPTRSRNVIDLFHQPKLYSTDRSPSPVTLTSPWRLNRRRVKRPLYPRSINDPVKARTAVLRLSDENLAGISSTQGRMQRPNSKVVRFIDDQNNEPVESLTESQKLHSNKPNNNIQVKTLTRPNSGIIPLGMYQYSLSIPPTKQSEKQDKLISTDTSGLLHEKGIGFHFQSNQSTEQLTNNSNILSQTELEDNILSRLVSQISDQLAKNQLQSHDTSSKENLQHLIETALLERIGSMISPTPTSPDRTSQLLQPERQHLKTPSLSSLDRSSQLNLLTIPTPMDSINKSELSYPNDPFEKKRKTPEPVSNWQPYNPDEESIFRNPRSSPTNRRYISTPEPSFGDNLSLQSKLRSQSSSPVKQKSVMISPFPLSPQMKYPSEKNVSERSTAINSQSLNSNSTALIETRSSSFTEPFSLTPPDTFSDGMWLVDRSVGEAPNPVSYNKLKLIMSKMEPIQSSTTKRNNYLTRTFSISKSTNSSSNSSSNTTTTTTKQSKQDQISQGQFPHASTTSNRFNSNQINPLNNPLLHVLAIKNSNAMKQNQLSHNEYDEMKKMLKQLKQIRQSPNNNNNNNDNNNNNIGIMRSPSLEWLANLSGSSLSQLNLHQSTKQNCSSKSDLTYSHTDDMMNKLKTESCKISIDDQSKHTAVSPDHSRKSNHSTSKTGSPKISMLRQVELVHSDDSEATTIDDEAYEDDFTGEQTN